MSDLITIRCPKCRSANYFNYNDEHYQCQNCYTLYDKHIMQQKEFIAPKNVFDMPDIEMPPGKIELAPKNNILEAKPDMSLLPLDLLEGLARAYEYGCVKYSKNSWRKGFKQSNMLAAALRHITDYKDKGQMFDLDAIETADMHIYHIDMAIFNLLCVKDSILNHPELDDRYIKEEKDDSN